MTTDSDAPAWAGAVLEIDLTAIVANWRQLRDMAAPGECAAVVKADAYGLGAARVVPALASAGCRRFFVAHLDEALAIAPLLPPGSVAVLGGLPPGAEAEYRAAGIVPVLNHLGEIARWQARARTEERPLPAFVHIDTGMNRLGLPPAELDLLTAEPARLDGLDLKGWISHFACADEAGHPMTETQTARFRAALARLPAAPASLANSSGLFRGARFDLARPGCALYGINPTPEAPNPMRPVVRLWSRVLQVRHIDSPTTVGYGAAHAIEAPGRVATVSIGYADGYSRTLSGTGHVLAAGMPAPVIGRISMDLMTVDVSALPEGALKPGDLVAVIGPHRPVDHVAAEAGTIGYEILTSLGRRYHRRYLEAGAA